ncbi:25S rRNA (adenine2142-N1)-methyltransferase [Xanthoria calcicola]
MAGIRKRRKPLLLSHTRPPSTHKTPILSSQATRSSIRKHHVLQKQLQAAVLNGDSVLKERLQAQLEASGGLQRYQEASIQGQSSERGGDSSKVLMEWITENASQYRRHGTAQHAKLRMLEVGALKVDNACSRSGIFTVTRIDLHSQHPDIQMQDFMEMPVPSPGTLAEDGFDVVSLSLVVNYLGDPFSRGDMLKRVSSFLRSSGQTSKDEARSAFPALFLVLPASCVTNSRYLDEERLEGIMITLGYVQARRKLSQKLVYYLWRYEGSGAEQAQTVSYKKQEIRPGGSRNNFSIVLQW